jgi:hypothetical protein
VLVCCGSGLCGAAEPNEQDIQLAKEKMDQLREVYKQVQQAEAELQRLIEEAERKEPLLRPTKDALKRIEDFYEHDLAKGHERFGKLVSDSNDPNAIYRLYEECMVVFSQNKSVELLSDPNQERLLKKPMIHYFRTVVAKDSFTAFVPQFDPNDPNDEKLWQNIKQMHSKRAPEEYLRRKREYYIEEKGVPEWLPDYAGSMAFANGMINSYKGGIHLLTPQEVRDAEERVNKLYHKMSKIYYRWGSIRHLLTSQKQG